MIPRRLLALAPLLSRLASASAPLCARTTDQLLLHPTCESYSTNHNMSRASCISVTHGGGPMPLLGDPSQKQLATSMRKKAPEVMHLNSNPPKAIVLLTAHWEEHITTISSGPAPELLYDYGGFPAEAYEFKYPAPGSPEVAAKVRERLAEAGIESRLDLKRGWDHGVFVPMLLIRPQADIPIVQMSVLASQSPKELYALGKALEPLRDENIAILGSGSAGFHNFRLFFGGGGSKGEAKATHSIWTKTLHDSIAESDPVVRGGKLEKWRDWEGAYSAHPRNAAEHFSPLIVCAGAAGHGTAKGWVDEMVGWNMETFYWD